MKPINIDADPMNQDWTKQSWDLPPYKSKEFFEIMSEDELSDFRKLPVYKFAVKRGLIKDDEWVGKEMTGYYAKIENGLTTIVARKRTEDSVNHYERWSWQDRKWVDGPNIFREMSGIGGDGYGWKDVTKAEAERLIREREKTFKEDDPIARMRQASTDSISPHLPIPTEALVRSSVEKFDNEEAVTESTISKLLKLFPRNISLGDVLLKVIVLNNLYSTRIIATNKVAEHIVSQNIDERLKEGNPKVVDLISRIKLGNKTRNNYSFATKYCSWHNQEHYPIYDRIVDQMLWGYRKQDSFWAFRREDLWEYVKFREIMLKFREHYGLAAFDFKDIDKFLWQEGKKVFP